MKNKKLSLGPAATRPRWRRHAARQSSCKWPARCRCRDIVCGCADAGKSGKSARNIAAQCRCHCLAPKRRNMRSRSALVCVFLAILELIRLQAVLARQDNVFGEIVLKKHTGFDALMAENPPVQDDWT